MTHGNEDYRAWALVRDTIIRVILGFYWGYTGIYWGYLGIMENQMEKKMENEMETTPANYSSAVVCFGSSGKTSPLPRPRGRLALCSFKFEPQQVYQKEMADHFPDPKCKYKLRQAARSWVLEQHCML